MGYFALTLVFFHVGVSFLFHNSESVNEKRAKDKLRKIIKIHVLGQPI